RVADRASRFGISGLAGVYDDRDGLELGLGVLPRLLELRELPPAERRSLDGDLTQLDGAHPAAGLAGHGKRKRGGTDAAGALGGNGGGPAQHAARHLGGLADADQQDPQRLAAPVDQQRLVALALVVAGTERARQPSPGGAIEVAERGGEVRALRHRDGEERRLDLRERLGGDRALHLRCSMMASAKAEVATSVAPGIWRARS